MSVNDVKNHLIFVIDGQEICDAEDAGMLFTAQLDTECALLVGVVTPTVAAQSASWRVGGTESVEDSDGQSLKAHSGHG